MSLGSGEKSKVTRTIFVLIDEAMLHFDNVTEATIKNGCTIQMIMQKSSFAFLVDNALID